MTTKDIQVVPDYFLGYIGLVPDHLSIKEAFKTYGHSYLCDQFEHYEKLGNQVYAPGKWTIKETLMHIIDTERIFAYRALRIARGDKSPLAGFEQDGYVTASKANDRSISSILEEFKVVRSSSEILFDFMNEEELQRTGIASDMEVSALALGFMTLGHMIHHQNIVVERYYPLLNQ